MTKAEIKQIEKQSIDDLRPDKDDLEKIYNAILSDKFTVSIEKFESDESGIWVTLTTINENNELKIDWVELEYCGRQFAVKQGETSYVDYLFGKRITLSIEHKNEKDITKKIHKMLKNRRKIRQVEETKRLINLGQNG
jgi:hypothetical protein